MSSAKSEAAKNVPQVQQQTAKLGSTVIDFTQMNLEQLKVIQKLLTERKKSITPEKPANPQRDARRSLGKSAMDELLGFNKAFNTLKKWKTEDGFTTSKGEAFSYESLGFENLSRLEFMFQKLPNILPFFSKVQTHITPRQMLDKLALVCSWDDAKFATQQRSRLTAYAKR